MKEEGTFDMFCMHPECLAQSNVFFTFATDYMKNHDTLPIHPLSFQHLFATEKPISELVSSTIGNII
jgi:hypothetical protein